MSNNIKGILYGIISSATFGMIPLFAIPVIKGGMASESILFYRFFLSAIAMGVLILLRKDTLKITVKQLSRVIFMGLMYAATAALLLESYKYISSGLATAIHFLYPAMVALLMTIVYKEKNNVFMYIGIAMAIKGVLCLCFGEGIDSIEPKGMMFAIGTIFTYAFFIVGVNKNRSISNLNGHTITFYVLLSGSMLFLVMALLNNGGIEIPTRQSDIINLVLLAIIPTMISDLTLVLAIKNIGSTVTSVLGSMEPITAMILGVIVFGERLTALHLAGIITVIIAITLVIVSKTIRKDKRQLKIDRRDCNGQ